MSLLSRSSALILGCLSAALPAAPLFAPAFGGQRFEHPVDLVQDTAGRWYVAEQEGRIWRLDGSRRELFADLREDVRTDNPEEGLLSLAFDPKDSRLSYVLYSVEGARPRKSRLAELKGGHSRTVLEVEKRWGNHNGGTLLFGPDGYLYASLGDGGGAGDSRGASQDLQELLGKVIRIDPSNLDQGLDYHIPPDNPFVGRPNARTEIWAYGLRNLWRMRFDPQSGELWGGDVGQDEREEVDVIERGGNYGWNWREGTQDYKPGGPKEGLIEPVVDYGHDLGRSITGGVVARHGAPEWAAGRYLFADFVSKKLWSVDAQSRDKESLRLEGECPEPPASFAQGQDGKVYLVGYDGGLFELK